MNKNKTIEKELEAYRQQLPEPAEDWHWKVRKAVSCIHTHLYHPQLNVGWMKEQCEVRGHSFAAKFRYYARNTPNKYILHHRIKAGKLLFNCGQLKEITVSAIAYEVGFSGTSTFSKCFKRETGQSPTEWRKKHGWG